MNSHSERVAWLAFLPIVVTGGFYVLPLNWQSQVLIQFIPQISAYLALGLWAFHNTNRISKLGLEPHKVGLGLQWGTITGILLGVTNSILIIFLIPTFGGSIDQDGDTLDILV